MHHQSILSPSTTYEQIGHTTDQILKVLKRLSHYDLSQDYYQDKEIHIRIDRSLHGEALSIIFLPLHPKKEIIPYTTRKPMIIAPQTQLLSISLYRENEEDMINLTYQESHNVHLSYGKLEHIYQVYDKEYLYPLIQGLIIH